MRFFYLLLITLFVNTISICAQVPKVGSFWNHGSLNPSTSESWSHTDYVIQDSTTTTGAQIFTIERHTVGWGYANGYTNIDTFEYEIRNDSVFEQGNYYFHSNLLVGDTLSNASSSYNYYYVVDSISSITLDTHPLRRFHMSQYAPNPQIYCRTVSLIERIGPIGYNKYLWTHLPTCQQAPGAILTCFSFDDIYNYHSNDTNCSANSFNHDTTTININNIHSPSNKVTISPNPFRQQTTINLSSHQNYDYLDLVILDLTGQEIKHIQTANSQTIQLFSDTLQTGIYIYQLFGDGLLVHVGKIIILKE